MIYLEDVSKIFKIHEKAPGFVASLKSLCNRKWIEKNALTSVNLKINPGEIVGLVGANGAGKTTLIKILTGIISPTSGTVNVMGFTPFERSINLRKQISLIMGQKAQLWWDLPAADCFELIKEIYEIPDDLFKKNLNELIEKLDVKSLLHIQIRRLSLGERMKMELIASLLHDPKVIFLDEPTIGLDITAQKAMRSFIQEYRKTKNPIIVLTSHYMEDIEQLCERIVVLRQGSIVYDGSLKKIKEYASPQIIINVQYEKLYENYNTIIQNDLSQIGKIIKSTNNEVIISVSKEKISKSTSLLLSIGDVVDYTKFEQDISETIERLLHSNLPGITNVP